MITCIHTDGYCVWAPTRHVLATCVHVRVRRSTNLRITIVYIACHPRYMHFDHVLDCIWGHVGCHWQCKFGTVFDQSVIDCPIDCVIDVWMEFGTSLITSCTRETNFHKTRSSDYDTMLETITIKTAHNMDPKLAPKRQ